MLIRSCAGTFLCVDTLFLYSHVTEVLSLQQQKVWPTYLFKSFLSPFPQKPAGRGRRMRGDRGREKSSAVRMERWKERGIQYVGSGLFHVTFYKSNCPSVKGQKLPLVSPFICLIFSINGSPNLLLPVTVIQSRAANTPARWHLVFTVNLAFLSKDSLISWKPVLIHPIFFLGPPLSSLWRIDRGWCHLFPSRSLLPALLVT